MVFTIVALALLMMSIDSTIVATALNSLRDGLQTSINWAGWTITAYSFGFLLALPVSGKLSEQYGRRRIFLGSIVAFTIASLCCGLADNIYVLIALRAVQAAGGAGFTPSATGIIVDHFGETRDRAISLFGSIFSIGAMIGPVFGGLFVHTGLGGACFWSTSQSARRFSCWHCGTCREIDHGPEQPCREWMPLAWRCSLAVYSPE